MGSSIDLIPAALACLMFLALTSPSQAQNSPADYVNAHNAVRKQVGVGPISWDPKFASYAQNYANKRAGDCDMIHSDGPYGENIVWGSWDISGVEAVKLWADEKPFYDYKSNSCAPGKKCGHYTQIVWRNSVRVGCGKTKCKKGGAFISCSYDPPGNIVGQRPY